MKNFQQVAIELNNEINKITLKGKITEAEKEVLKAKHFELRVSFNSDVYYTEEARDYAVKGYLALIEQLMKLPLEEEVTKPPVEEVTPTTVVEEKPKQPKQPKKK